MKQRLSYAVAVGGALMMLATGCSKKIGAFQPDYFSVNPNPLEVVGEQIPANVTGNVPSKFFVKNAQVTVTPYLVYDGNELASTPYVLQGEKVRGNGYTINYDRGGAFTMPVKYAYSPEMMNSELQLGFTVEQGGKQYVLPRVTVANGVNATAALADPATVKPALAADKFQKIINEKYQAEIKFVVGQANVRDSELKGESMTAFNETLRNVAGDSTRQIAEINISSYASPEGSLDFNTRLAENREKNTESYLKGQFKKDNISEFGELTSQFTPEDWEGFQELLAKSDIQDKDLILSVLSQFSDPEIREKEIRNLSTVFDQVSEQILPQLRRSRLTASVNVIGKSDDEIKRLYAEDPSKLSVDELLYCATLTNDPATRKAIYSTTTRVYPNDYRAYNNLGMLQYQEQDYTTAASNFKKALSLEPSSKEVQMNQGLVALVNRDYQQAMKNFGATTALKENGEALGTYNLLQGDVEAANRAFADVKSNNAALAKILKGDYNDAKNILSAIQVPDATTYYLNAIVGARTNNESMVKSNLAKAINLDKSLLNRAKNDIEFSKFNLSGVL